jgi:hypothetical protein
LQNLDREDFRKEECKKCLFTPHLSFAPFVALFAPVEGSKQRELTTGVAFRAVFLISIVGKS